MSISFLRGPKIRQPLGGIARSTQYDWHKKGLLPSLISFGPRASGLPESEVQEIAAARVAGYSDDQIKALVVQIHERRKLAAPKIGGAA